MHPKHKNKKYFALHFGLHILFYIWFLNKITQLLILFNFYKSHELPDFKLLRKLNVQRTECASFYVEFKMLTEFQREISFHVDAKEITVVHLVM